ncbi:hypothetical protein Vqi01_22750 [Micromonospora qiuiae]|uniref:Transcriptional regulator n=1 Tax=Micromonospora qiuiae TaxID=502268 RepID=A0ABQ4JAB7_9ACTN|nr:hypothetical protein Vqi01_22750 [Micromonospora qiuiae]
MATGISYATARRRYESGTLPVPAYRLNRLISFGVEYVEAALTAQVRRLLVVGPAEVDDDLVREVTEILTSLCARLHASPGSGEACPPWVEAAIEGSV